MESKQENEEKSGRERIDHREILRKKRQQRNSQISAAKAAPEGSVRSGAGKTDEEGNIRKSVRKAASERSCRPGAGKTDEEGNVRKSVRKTALEGSNRTGTGKTNEERNVRKSVRKTASKGNGQTQRKQRVFGILAGMFSYIFGGLFAALQEKYRKEKLRRKRIRKKLLNYQRTHTEEQVKAYRRKIWKKDLAHYGIPAGGVLLVLAVVLLLGKTVAHIKVKSEERAQQKEAETVQMEMAQEEEPTFPEKDIILGSTGSHMLHSPFITSYTEDGVNYDFSGIFQYITPYYSAPDFMTCEFEGDLSGGYYSGYPNFNSPDEIMTALKNSGIDLVMLASNHIYDGWKDGFQRTMDTLDAMKFPYLGIRQKVEDKKYKVVDIKGIKVGFTDYVYESSSYTGGQKSLNAVPLEPEDAERVTSFDPDNDASIQQFYQEMEENIAGMKADGAQFIVAQMHWGYEYNLVENEYQRAMAQKLCDLGVDAIIGGHTHCLQPIDLLTSGDGTHKMFCIYSEGNSLSNQRVELLYEDMPTGHTEDGVIINLTLHQDSHGTVSIKDVEAIPLWVYRWFDDYGFCKYHIYALDDVANLESKTGMMGIRDLAQASYDRTMEELEPGLKKVKTYLSQKNREESAEEAPEKNVGESVEEAVENPVEEPGKSTEI